MTSSDNEPQAAHELILGGARSGKSRTAEARAAAWLAAGPDRQATLIATALAADDEMAQRIRRHRADRAARVAALKTVEAPSGLPRALRQHADAQRLIVVDCLTLWLTQCLLPPTGSGMNAVDWQAEQHAFVEALRASPGPVVLVSNEIGLGVLPMGRDTRAFVDTLGFLHQEVARLCERVTLMVAGCEMTAKDSR